MISSKSENQAPAHFVILDGLRGIAALIVLLYHIGEAHAADRFTQLFNHGYLAVDFFFLLSGFVVGYAYDRQRETLSTGSFCVKRLIRLQPMVALGTLIGLAFFYLGWRAPGMNDSFLRVLLLTLLGALMIPVPISVDVRGWNETFPLNGPQWSLFFEYIANLLYVLFLRYLPKVSLAILTVAAGVLTVTFLYTNPNGDMIGGWSLAPQQVYTGAVRLLYPFLMGLLLARIRPKVKVPFPFIFSTLLLSTLMLTPRIGGSENLLANAIYEGICILFIFPLIIIIGSNEDEKERFLLKPAQFLGRISYPLYLIHYPFICIYYKYMKGSPTDTGAILYGVLIFVGSVIAAALIERFYERPVRSFLTKKIAARKSQ